MRYENKDRGTYLILPLQIDTKESINQSTDQIQEIKGVRCQNKGKQPEIPSKRKINQ